MKSLGSLIRKYIAENGLTIYKTAALAGINRTTLQKVLSDERNASEELIKKLLIILKLSPAEEQELRELFEIQQIGEDVYLQRQYIKRSIEDMAGLDGWFAHSPTPNEIFVPSQNENLIVQTESSLVRGLPSVRHLLYSIVCYAQQKENSELLLYAPGNLSALKALLFPRTPVNGSHAPTRLRHITPMIKVPAATAPLTNLEILFNVFPFTVSQYFCYEVFCFYSRELLPEPVQHAFPYYLVADNIVLLLSCDGQTALCLTRKDIISYFRNLFLDSLGKATSMIFSQTTPISVLQNMLEDDFSSGPLHSLEWQPCLATFLTEEMVEKYVIPDLPGREEIIRLGCARIRQLANMEDHSCIFSRSGMEEFAQTGMISDIPSQYAYPLDIEDRIQILTAMYNTCLEDKEFLRLINPITFRLSRHFYAALRGGDVLDFCGIDTVHSEYNYIRITEPSFLDAFSDFYRYLPKSGLICSKEETLNAVAETIRRLKEFHHGGNSTNSI